MRIPTIGKKTKAAAGPAKQKQASGGLSVWAYAAVMMFAAAAAVPAVALVVRAEAQSSQRDLLAAQQADVAPQLAAQVKRHMQERQAALAGLAQVPSVRQTAAGAAAPLPLPERTVFPEALRLLALPAGLAEPVLSMEPPLGYALLDMLRRAEADKKAPPPEVHLPGQPAAHLNLVQPVLNADGQVVAHLLLSYPASALGTAVMAPAGGGFSLRQGAAVLVQQAGGVGAEQQAPVAGTSWRLTYQPPAPKAAESGLGTLLTMVPVAVAALLAVIAALTFLLRRALTRDGATVVGIFKDAQTDSLQLNYRAELRELAPYLAAAALEARRLDVPAAAAPKLRESSVALAKPAAAAAPKPVAPAPKAPARKPAVDEVTERLSAEADAPSDEAVGLDIREEAPAPPAAPSSEDLPGVELDLSGGTAEGMPVNPSVLRAYDVRGIVSDGLSAKVVRAFGRAIGTEAAAAGQQEIVVARDGRLTSDELADALIEGLVATGRQVIDIGRVPTPVMNFATFHLNTGAGVMVTGSHNPADYNGLKIVIGGRSWCGEDIQRLGQRVRQGEFIRGEGSCRQQDVLPDYIDRVLQDVTLHRPLRIVVDAGNGVGGEVAPQLLRAMGCEVEELFCEVNGNFPHHDPDPTVPDNLEALISLVRLQGADLGIAFDGDADRLGVVDGKGKIIWADRQLMLFAQEVLSRHPGADIVFDVKCSSDLAQLIIDNAGVPVMWKSGHSMIKSKLRETNAPLAGEMSGHIFFNDHWYGFDDGIYAAARLLEILSMDPRSPLEVFADLPESVSTPEIRVDLAEGESTALMEALEARLTADFKQARITTIDGVRVDTPAGWGLVRASNTTPSLVLRFEARDRPSMEKLQAAFRERILAVKPELVLPF